MGGITRKALIELIHDGAPVKVIFKHINRNPKLVKPGFDYERTLLSAACQAGHVDLIRALVERDDVDAEKDKPFYYLCGSEQLDQLTKIQIMEELEFYGGDTDVRVNHKTPFDIASDLKEDVVSEWLQSKAQIRTSASQMTKNQEDEQRDLDHLLNRLVEKAGRLTIKVNEHDSYADDSSTARLNPSDVSDLKNYIFRLVDTIKAEKLKGISPKDYPNLKMVLAETIALLNRPTKGRLAHYHEAIEKVSHCPSPFFKRLGSIMLGIAAVILCAAVVLAGLGSASIGFAPGLAVAAAGGVCFMASIGLFAAAKHHNKICDKAMRVESEVRKLGQALTVA